jgi:hypothetical protein
MHRRDEKWNCIKIGQKNSLNLASFLGIFFTFEEIVCIKESYQRF